MLPIILLNGWTKNVNSSWGFSDILAIENCDTRVWTCTEPDFWLYWLEGCNSDNHNMISWDATLLQLWFLSVFIG